MTKSQTKFIEGNPANGVKPANYFIKSTNPETI